MEPTNLIDIIQPSNKRWLLFSERLSQFFVSTRFSPTIEKKSYLSRFIYLLCLKVSGPLRRCFRLRPTIRPVHAFQKRGERFSDSGKFSHLAGFTLIELLVVIAIIAILAAILFPVFAQAKASAKAAASLSNTKQIGLSILMYANDYDDNYVIAGQWHSEDPDAFMRYPASPYMPWTGLVEAYVKNRQILESPFTSATSTFTGPGANKCSRLRECALLYPTYGYNASYLSPSIIPDDVLNTRISSLPTTAVMKPAEQVMLTEIWSRNNTGFGAFASGADIAYISLATSEAPDSASHNTAGNLLGRVSWGTYNNANNMQLQKKEEGLYRAGVAFRSAGRTPTFFTDGHAKTLKAEMLAAGTDWVDGVTFKAVNLQNEKYMWDTKGL